MALQRTRTRRVTVASPGSYGRGRHGLTVPEACSPSRLGGIRTDVLKGSVEMAQTNTKRSPVVEDLSDPAAPRPSGSSCDHSRHDHGAVRRVPFRGRSTTAPSSSKSLEPRQQAVIEALRKFVDTVDPRTLPDYGEGPAPATGNPQLCDRDGRPCSTRSATSSATTSTALPSR